MHMPLYSHGTAYLFTIGNTRDVILGKLEDEEKKAQEEIDRQDKARRKAEAEGDVLDVDFGYKNKSPYGQWVE